MRVLITGMSGTGKSTVVDALGVRGFAAVDLEDDWCVVGHDGRRLWDEDAVSALLDGAGDEPLFLAGCEENMTDFLPRFDTVVLLSAPWATLDERLAGRTTNDFGRSPAERAKVRRDQEEVEPLLRGIAACEIDTRADIDHVVAQVMRAAGVE